MSVKLEWRESATLKGGIIYGKNDLACKPGGIYEFTEKEAKEALRDFSNNFFPVVVEKSKPKEIKSKKNKSLKEDETETKD